MDIQHETWDTAVALTTSSTTTPTISFEKASAGTIHLPATNTAVTLTWYSGYTAPATSSTAEAATVFVAANDSSGAAVVQTIASGAGAYPIPVALAGCRFLRVTANVAGTAYFTWKT